jgi:hypothetical protein
MEQYNKNYIIIQIVRKQNKKMTKSQYRQIKKLFESLYENKTSIKEVYIEGSYRVNGIEMKVDLQKFNLKDLLQFFVSYVCYIQNLNPIYNINGNYSFTIGNLNVFTFDNEK